MKDENIHAACITEHWLKQENISKFVISGYNIVSTFYRKEHKRGGSLILLQEDYKWKPIEDIEKYSVEMEAEFSGIYISQQNIILLCIYRPPQGNIDIFITKLEELINYLYRLNSNIIITGDFNIDFKKDTNDKEKLLLIIKSCNLNQVFTESSRVTINSSTCIDNIFMENIDDIVEQVTINTHLSDHFAQKLSIYIHCKSRTTRKGKFMKIRPLSSENTHLFKQLLANTNWKEVLQEPNAEVSYELFHSRLLQHFNTSHPEKNIKITPKAKKYNTTAELRLLKNQLDAAHTITLVRKDSISKNLYQKLRQVYKGELENIAKTKDLNYIKNSDNKIKATWNVINSKLKQERNKRESKLKCDDFNNYFANIVTDLGLEASKNTSMEFLQRLNLDSTGSMFLYDITPDEILGEVRKFNPKNSLDVYGISVKILKAIIPDIVIVLCHILNKCFQQGIFPHKLKLAKVTPIFKKDDPNNSKNYRPISILPAMSKILEILLKNRLYKYLERKKFLNPYQHGFRKERSTITAMVDIIETINNSFNKKEKLQLGCLDLSKAFDCVNHDILLKKLEFYGVRGPVNSMFHSYLKDRRQVVFWNGQISKVKNMNMGVPQGSILGPLLFILYINDIASNVSCAKLCIYADDTTIINHHKEESTLNITQTHNIEEAHSWYKANGLQLNLEKTQTITCTTTHANSMHIKILGIHLDNQLNWSAHIAHLSKKLSTSIYCIRRIRNIINNETAILTYHAQFHSLMSYGLILWGASTMASKIFLLQKRAIRAIEGVGQRTSCRPLFQKFKILTLPASYILTCLIYIHSNPDLYTDKSFHGYETRNKHDLITSQNRISKTQNSFKYWGIKFFNKLPMEIRLKSKANFKKIVKTFLLENTVYDFNEYLNL